MTTPEQQACKDIKPWQERVRGFDPFVISFEDARNECVKAEISELRQALDAAEAELQALRGSAAPYCYVYEWDTEFGLVRRTRPANVEGRTFDRFVPLYTRPAVPLTDERIAEAMDVWRVSPTSEADFIKGIRAAEAAHNIKGAKP